jgi:hypothetical protein
MTATLRLYEITEMRARLDIWLEESEGELTPALEQLLAELDAKADEKVERIGLYLRELAAHAKALAEEEARLAARRQARERAIASLKAYLLSHMEQLGKTKVNGLLCTVAIQKNSAPSIECLDAQALHATDQGDLFVEKVITTSFRLRRDELIAAWKANLPLPPGVIITQGSHVRVR